MEWSGTEWNETNTSFHCLGILLLNFIPLDTPQINWRGRKIEGLDDMR
jgi:hypothetical protein